jgi:hypothetical protein
MMASLSLVLLLTAYFATLSSSVFADPSATTQQFFGFSGGGGNDGSQTPESCSIAKLQAQNQVLLDQITQINNDEQAKLNAISAQQKNLQPGDMAGNDALQQQQQQILDDSKSKLAAIKAQQDAIKKATEGPSDQCKTDLVMQTVANMQNMIAALNGGSISVAMDKVDSVTAEIESLEPKLAQSGVNKTDMATIKKDVVDVKADSHALRGFFTAMNAQASSFISQAEANPTGTYDSLSAGKTTLGRGLMSSASSAANNLVSSFTSLVNLFDKLSGTTAGGQ